MRTRSILGLGFPTLIPQNGVNTMQVADVYGVRIDGLLFDAGTTNSAALLTVGTAGLDSEPRRQPDLVQDVFFRIGGDIAGKATTSLVVNANDTIVDHIWAWRADHGNGGTVGWTINTADQRLDRQRQQRQRQSACSSSTTRRPRCLERQQRIPRLLPERNAVRPAEQAAWTTGSVNGYPAITVGR